MDRFIAIAIPSMGEVHPFLKSNMDRFIVKVIITDPETPAFKIQYG